LVTGVFFVASGAVALAEEGVGVVFVWLEPDAVEVAGDGALLALEGEELAVVSDPILTTGAYPEMAEEVAVPLAHWLVS